MMRIDQNNPFLLFLSHMEVTRWPFLAPSLFLGGKRREPQRTKRRQRSEIGELTGYHLAKKKAHRLSPSREKSEQNITYLENNAPSHLSGWGEKLPGYHLSEEKKVSHLLEKKILTGGISREHHLFGGWEKVTEYFWEERSTEKHFNRTDNQRENQ